MSREIETPVNATQACRLFGWGRSRMTAIKRSMGIKGRYLFPSDVVKFLKAHPDWKMTDAYPRKNNYS